MDEVPYISFQQQQNDQTLCLPSLRGR